MKAEFPQYQNSNKKKILQTMAWQTIIIILIRTENKSSQNAWKLFLKLYCLKINDFIILEK